MGIKKKRKVRDGVATVYRYMMRVLGNIIYALHRDLRSNAGGVSVFDLHVLLT